MNSSLITKRQNEDFSLKVQYAARVCFNKAELYNEWSWLACLVSAFSVLIPSTWPNLAMPLT